MDLEIEAPVDELEVIADELDDELFGDASLVTCIPAKCTSGVR